MSETGLVCRALTQPRTVLAVSVAALAACSASTSSSVEEAGAEQDLKSADCPAKVEVTISAPSVAADAKLASSWASDFDGDPDPAKAAQEQLTQLSSHLAKARSETAVKLAGTVGQRCFYATVDATSGQKNGFTVWFAQTSGPHGELQLRISRQLDKPEDTLFFKQSVKTLTATTLVLDTSKDATAYAQHTESGYHGEPEGPNAWIGSAKVTAQIAH